MSDVRWGRRGSGSQLQTLAEQELPTVSRVWTSGEALKPDDEPIQDRLTSISCPLDITHSQTFPIFNHPSTSMIALLTKEQKMGTGLGYMPFGRPRNLLRKAEHDCSCQPPPPP